MASDTDNDPAEMARHRPTLEPGPVTPPRKPTIFDCNASNPDFVPGYSVLRIEQVKYMTNSMEKTRLMNTIVDDIVASISSVTEYHRNGILSDDNIFQVSTMIQNIGQNNLKMQDGLEDKIARLKRQSYQQRHEYVELAQQMDGMGQMYAAKVGWLEEQLKMLKDRVARVEARGPRSRSQEERGIHERYRRYLENSHLHQYFEAQSRKDSDERLDWNREIFGKLRGYDDQQQMVQDEDSADGEWEEDTI